MTLLLLEIVTILSTIHLSYALNNKEFLPSVTLLKFATDVTDVWGFEDVALVDICGNDEDHSAVDMLKFINSDGKTSWRFLTSKDAKMSSTEIINVMSERAAVIINNDDVEYFSKLSFGHLETMTWFVPDTMNISTINLRLDSNLYLFTKPENSSVSLTETYSIKGGPHIKNHVGSWNLLTGLQIIEPSTWERRKNLSGVTIYDSVIIVNGYPVVVSTHQSNGTIDVIGYFPEILSLLSQVMGFKVQHVLSPDGLYGSQNKDGTWSGMVGMLQKGEADVCTGGLSITLEREEVIDFAMPLMEEQITFLLLNPSGKGTVNIWAYLKTFTVNSWIVIFITLAVFTIVLTIYGRCTSAISHKRNEFSLTASIGFMFTTLLQRGQHFIGKQNSIHMLILAAAMFCYLIFTYFSTILTSFMTILEPAIQINSFYDILKYDYHMITLKGSSIETFLEGTKPPSVFYDIYTKDMKGRQNAFLSSFPDVIKALQDDPKTGLFGPATMTYGISGLVELKLPESLSSYTTLGLQNNSEFRKIFDHHLLKMSQTGVISRVYNKWFNSTSFKINQDDEIIVLGYDNLIFPCLILAVGIALSLILVIAENCKKVLESKNDKIVD